MEEEEVANGGKSVALWAGLTTLFTNLAAINIVAILGEEDDLIYTTLAALITAGMVSASVYAKHRWDYYKRKSNGV